jgi:transcriptional regulator with XRE-family HTH domain
MAKTKIAKKAFGERLAGAMLDRGYRSSRGARSGVDVNELRQRARVSREMARRYVEGEAVPDLERVVRIAEWLGVRVAWLLYGEGSRAAAGQAAAEPGAPHEELTAEAREVGRVWSRLSADTRSVMREVLFLLALGEKRFPWLRRGRPSGETYDQWEKRQEQNFSALAQLAADRKAANTRWRRSATSGS